MERTPNESQHTKLTLDKKILPPFLPGFELATFRLWIRRSTNKLSWLTCSLGARKVAVLDNLWGRRVLARVSRWVFANSRGLHSLSFVSPVASSRRDWKRMHFKQIIQNKFSFCNQFSWLSCIKYFLQHWPNVYLFPLQESIISVSPRAHLHVVGMLRFMSLT